MENPLLVGLRDLEQMDKVLSSLQEIVESGTSVVFSFSTSGRVTVLLATAPTGAKLQSDAVTSIEALIKNQSPQVVR